MSSSADQRWRRRVVRQDDAATLPMASVVSARSRVAVHLSENRGADEAPTIEEQLDQARRAGIEEGRGEAFADARVVADRERAESLKGLSGRIAEACDVTARNRRAIVDEVVGEAVDLAFDLLSVLLDDELVRRQSPVRDAVVRALALAPDGEELRVRVHPGAQITSDEVQELAAVGPVSILSDPAIEPTGCVVEAGACRIDAQLGPALERVRAMLDQARGGRREEALS